MKVNFILPGLGDSGGIQVVKTYARLMNLSGIDTVIYCPILADNLHRYRSGFMNRLHQIYCTVKTIKEKRNSTNVKWIPCVSNRYVRSADHTIATMWATAYKVNKLSSDAGRKWYFVQGFEIWDNKQLGLMSYKLPLDKIVISNWLNDMLHENLKIGPFPVVHNGIDTSVFVPLMSERESKASPTILMLNHDNPVKGVGDGIRVIKEVIKKHPSVNIVMFGMNDNSNLPDYIEYYQNPSRDLLVRLYQNSDIFLFPSLQDGWGLTPIEAMACGCAVVGTQTGFVLDIGDNRKNMLISAPGDVDGMANNVNELLENDVLLNKIKNNGIETVKQLSWDISVKKMISILQKSSEQ